MHRHKRTFVMFLYNLKMISKYYQIVFNVLRLFFSHDINVYHISATTPILPLFAR